MPARTIKQVTKPIMSSSPAARGKRSDGLLPDLPAQPLPFHNVTIPGGVVVIKTATSSVKPFQRKTHVIVKDLGAPPAVDIPIVPVVPPAVTLTDMIAPATPPASEDDEASEGSPEEASSVDNSMGSQKMKLTEKT